MIQNSYSIHYEVTFSLEPIIQENLKRHIKPVPIDAI